VTASGAGPVARDPALGLSRGWWIALGTLAVLTTLLYARREGDFAGYVLVGDLALRGLDIYRDAPPNVSTWPPFFALLCVPLALLARVSLFGARVVWLAAGWGALLIAVRAIVSLVRPATETAAPASAERAVVLLSLLLCVRWVLSNFEHLQVNIILLALVAVGLAHHRDGRTGRSAALLGAAAALKVMPVLFAPYFAWRRQWRPALFTALAALAWSLVPAVVYGPHAFVDQLHAWAGSLRAGWSVGKMNISVYAALDRVIGHDLVPLASPGFNALPPSGDPRVRLGLALCLLALLVLGLVTFRGAYDPAARTTVAEWSIVLLVANLFGTVAWKAYLVVLLLPMALFVATWRDQAVTAEFRRRLRTLTWAGFALGLAAADALVGRSLSWRLEMGSVPTLMALLVLGMLFWYRVALPAHMETT